jgi:hypothetical protein
VSDVSPVEAELARLMQRLPGHAPRSVLTGIFRQAIALHRAVGVQGYLGAPPSNPRDISIMRKHLFLCAAYGGKDFYLMIDNVPGLQEAGTWRGFECGPTRSTQGELAWIHCTLDELQTLEAILTDGDVWLAYKRMLQRIESINRSDRPATLQRLSVLS